jgi:N6-L-threonylcarbamoyladenine synthase
MSKFPLILGLESSCDETAAAIVGGDKHVHASRVSSQLDSHRPWGGVVPEIAARAHVDMLAPLVSQAAYDAGVSLSDVDAVAATAGPGLIGGVMVGLVTGKMLAWSLGKPLLAINHLEGHALSPRLVSDVAFPYLLLLVSGGHCQLLEVRDVGVYRRLATTIDDAVGEAFDKVAKLLDLGYPGGPAVERLAKQGRAQRFDLPRPMVGRAEPHFSFSGLKSAVLRETEALTTLTDQDRADLCAAFQSSVVACLVDRTRRAIVAAPQCGTLVVAGGVAANGAVRAALEQLAASEGLTFAAPPAWLCTDNAAMIAWAGIERFRRGMIDDLACAARARWPLDPLAPAARGAGVKA